MKENITGVYIAAFYDEILFIFVVLINKPVDEILQVCLKDWIKMHLLDTEKTRQIKHQQRTWKGGSLWDALINKPVDEILQVCLKDWIKMHLLDTERTRQIKHQQRTWKGVPLGALINKSVDEILQVCLKGVIKMHIPPSGALINNLLIKARTYYRFV